MKTEKSIVRSYKKVPNFFKARTQWEGGGWLIKILHTNLKKRQLLIKEKMVIMANQLDLAAWYVMFVFLYNI